MFTCFNCGTPIGNINMPCPNCGYKFTDTDNGIVCPNMVGTVCRLTENVCNLRSGFGKCPTKNKCERENGF